MSRTLAKISRNGQQLTDFVPIKCKTEFGMSTGHMTIPAHLSSDIQLGEYTLHPKDGPEIPISFTGVCGPKAYFHSITDR